MTVTGATGKALEKELAIARARHAQHQNHIRELNDQKHDSGVVGAVMWAILIVGFGFLIRRIADLPDSEEGSD